MSTTQHHTHAPHLADASPEFLAAVDELMRTAEALGQDHPEAKRAMQRAMMLAPRTLRDEITRMAESTGLLPKPDGYTEDGQPMVSLEGLAAQWGMTLAEAQARMDEMLVELEAAGVSMPTIDPARVHRVQ